MHTKNCYYPVTVQLSGTFGNIQFNSHSSQVSKLWANKTSLSGLIFTALRSRLQQFLLLTQLRRGPVIMQVKLLF